MNYLLIKLPMQLITGNLKIINLHEFISLHNHLNFAVGITKVITNILAIKTLISLFVID